MEAAEEVLSLHNQGGGINISPGGQWPVVVSRVRNK